MYTSPELEKVLSEPIAIMGFGTTGRSVLKWLSHRGVSAVKVIDDAWTPEKYEALSSFSIAEPVLVESDGWMSVRSIVVSPGVFPSHRVRRWGHENGCRILNDIQLWAWAMPPEVLSIGITGSNGKSTVTAWIEYVLQKTGKRAVAAGNIGLPVLDVLHEIEKGHQAAPDIWVLELSSFQLEDCEPLPLTAATILNISEDHLDYHGSMSGYLKAKSKILEKASGVVLSEKLKDSECISQKLALQQVTYFGIEPESEWRLDQQQLQCRQQKLLNVPQLPLLGDHNALNALTVLALLSGAGITASSEMLAALCDFTGLPHRVERIAQFKGVDFIEDSKGTNVGSTVAALEGLGSRYSRLILIAGGDGKGQSFEPLVKPMVQFCREVLLIGRDAERLAEGLQGQGVPYRYFDRLESAVEAAFHQAEPGEAVVLSPACASWDMFRNYLHRAEVFTQTVKQCIEQASLC